MKFLKKNIFLILNIISIIFVFFLLINYMKYDILLLHDRWCAQKDPFEFLYLGRFPGKLLNLFLYQFVPYIFPFINLNDLQCTLFSFIKILILISIIFIYVKIFYIFRKDNDSIYNYKSFSIVFLLVFFLIFNNYYLPLKYLFQIIDSTTYFEWGLPLLFYSLFVYLLIKNFIKKRKISRKDSLLIILICILCSISNEMYAVSAFFFLLYLSISQFFIFIIRKFNLKLNLNFFSEYKQLSFEFYNNNFNTSTLKELFNKFIYFIVCFFVMSMSLILYLLFTNYSEGNYVGGGHSVDFVSAFNSLNVNFLPFLVQYYNNYVVPYYYLHVLIAISLIYIFLEKKIYYKKVIIISIAIFLGLFTFIIFILFGGMSFNGQFFLMHDGIKYSYIKILLLILTLIFGYIFSFIEFRRNFIKTDIILCYIFLCFLFNIICSKFYNWLDDYKQYVNFAKNLRIVSYVSDKTALTFANLDGSIYLPILYYKYYGCELYQIKFACYDCQNSIPTMFKIKMQEINNDKSRLYSFNDFIGLENDTDNYYFLYLKYIYGVNVESLQFTSIGKVNAELKKRGIDVISTNSKRNLWFTSLNYMKNKKINYDELIKNNEKQAWAWASRGRFYRRKEQWNNALQDYSKAISLDSKNISYYLLRGLLYKHMNMHKEAASDFQVVANSNPLGLFSNYLLIKEYESIGDYKKAINICSDLIKIFPFGHADHERDLYFERAFLKEKIGDYEGAVADYIKSSEISEYSYMFDLYKKLGENFMNIEKYNDAIEYFNDQLMYTPDNYKLYYYRGKAYFNVKVYDKALDDYITFLEEVSPDTLSSEEKIKVLDIKKSIKIFQKNIKNNSDLKYLYSVLNKFNFS